MDEKRFYTVPLTGTMSDWKRLRGAFEGDQVFRHWWANLPEAVRGVTRDDERVSGAMTFSWRCRLLDINTDTGQALVAVEADTMVLEDFESWRIGKTEAQQLPPGAARLVRRIGPDSDNPLDADPEVVRRLNISDARPTEWPAEVVK